MTVENCSVNQWDKYFLEICNTVAGNTKCLSRKVGAILVKDKRILATGYNGPPAGIPSCLVRYKKDKAYRKVLRSRTIDPRPGSGICPRKILGYESGQGLEWCVAAHAERSVLITAARYGIATKNASLFMNCPIPCKDCLIEIINAGIKEIVVTELTYYDKMSEYLLKGSGIRYRVYRV